MVTKEEIERHEYLVRFLRGCAIAAERKQLGVDDEGEFTHGRLLINGNLMREAADALKNLIPDEHISFLNPTDELHYNLVRAERHAQQAFDLLHREDAPKRSIWFRMAVGRAQSILMTAYVRDIKRRGKP